MSQAPLFGFDKFKSWNIKRMQRDDRVNTMIRYFELKVLLDENSLDT